MDLPAPGRDARDHLLRLDSPILVSNVSEVNPRCTATSLLTPQPPPRRWAPRRCILTHAAAPTATSTRGPEAVGLQAETGLGVHVGGRRRLWHLNPGSRWL